MWAQLHIPTVVRDSRALAVQSLSPPQPVLILSVPWLEASQGWVVSSRAPLLPSQALELSLCFSLLQNLSTSLFKLNMVPLGPPYRETHHQS